jgi:hypothetical protein
MKYLILIIFILITSSGFSQEINSYKTNQSKETRIYFSTGKELYFSFDLNSKSLKEFQFSQYKALPYLTQYELNQLRKLKPKNSVDYNLIRFIKENFEANVIIPTSYKPTQKKSWNNICALKGKVITGKYTIKDKTRYRNRKVLEKKTACLGLCGKECFPQNFKRKGRITMECFDHDLCHQETKDFWGCWDELMDALPGFLFAPKCKI